MEMIMSILNLTAQPFGLAINAASYWIHTFRGAFLTRQRRRRAIAQLHALSDRSLADIGIERSEIEAIVMAGSRDAARRCR